MHNMKDENILFKILNAKEDGYLNKLTDKLGVKYIENKITIMNKLLIKLEGNRQISSNDFEAIRQIAISKGGFLKNCYRREFYKKAFSLDNESVKFISYNDNRNYNENNLILHKFFEGKFEEHLYTKSKKKNENIIEVDIKRTIANSFFSSAEEEVLNTLKNKLTTFIKKFMIINKDYNYYQGFHDIGLYIYLIFNNSESFALQMLQRISEYFLKDYLLENSNGQGFRFETVFKIIKDIIKTEDKMVYSFYEDNPEIPDPIFCLPWIITFFTHDINELFTVLRLFDYLLFSHPNAIYFISSKVNLFLF